MMGSGARGRVKHGECHGHLLCLRVVGGGMVLPFPLVTEGQWREAEWSQRLP